MFGKQIEYWAVLIGMAFYVASRDAETENISKRVGKTLASGLLAYGTSSEVSGYLGMGEGFAAILIMAFGLIVLDMGTALLSDKEFFKDLVKKKLGGKFDV